MTDGVPLPLRYRLIKLCHLAHAGLLSEARDEVAGVVYRRNEQLPMHGAGAGGQDVDAVMEEEQEAAGDQQQARARGTGTAAACCVRQ